MMVSKSVDIEETKTIIGVLWLKMGWYNVFTIDGNELRCPVDAVNMDDTYSGPKKCPNVCMFFTKVNNP